MGEKIAVSELWFNDHERVVLIGIDGGVLLSYDVYCNRWNYPVDYKVSISDKVSLIYHRVSDLKELPENVVWIELVGVAIDTQRELVNVRVFVKDKISSADVKRILEFLENNILRQCYSAD